MWAPSTRRPAWGGQSLSQTTTTTTTPSLKTFFKIDFWIFDWRRISVRCVKWKKYADSCQRRNWLKLIMDGSGRCWPRRPNGQYTAGLYHWAAHCRTQSSNVHPLCTGSFPLSYFIFLFHFFVSLRKRFSWKVQMKSLKSCCLQFQRISFDASLIITTNVPLKAFTIYTSCW